MMVENLLRYWNEHEALSALRRRATAPAKRELLERYLDRQGWKWIKRISVAIDRQVILEEWAE
jgi:hypothetical protein